MCSALLPVAPAAVTAQQPEAGRTRSDSSAPGCRLQPYQGEESGFWGQEVHLTPALQIHSDQVTFSNYL